MRRVSVCLVLALSLSGAAFSQTNPAFEAADVHLSAHTNNPALRAFVRDDRYELHLATIVDLIRRAWGVQADRVAGGPAWLDTHRFDVIAKVPPRSTPEALKTMLQGLLIDRFGLVVHNDTAPRTAWVLSASAQPRVKQSDGSGGGTCVDQPAQHSETVNVVLNCRNVTMSAFAETLRTLSSGGIGGYIPGNSEVVDLTGMKGAWDFNIRWSGKALLAEVGSEGISLFNAIDKQLGLKLEFGKAPLPVIVVDRVNEKPTENLPETAQKLPVLPIEFDVVDIKLSTLDKQDPPPQLQPGGRLVIKGIRLIDLIVHAWGFDGYDDMVVGDPKFTERFDIVAQAPSYASSGVLKEDDTMRLMVRAMLRDRFRLAAHLEERPAPAYVLTGTNSRLKNEDPANRSGCRNTGTPPGALPSALITTYSCQNLTIAMFADQLHGIAAGYIRHPVVDATGIPGQWDFMLSFSPARLFNGQSADVPDGAISLSEAVEKQMGLKLEMRKHPIEVLVVDHVERLPTDN